MNTTHEGTGTKPAGPTRQLSLMALHLCGCLTRCDRDPQSPYCCNVCRTLELIGEKRCAKQILNEHEEVPQVGQLDPVDTVLVPDRVISFIEDECGVPLEMWQAEVIRRLWR